MVGMISLYANLGPTMDLGQRVYFYTDLNMFVFHYCREYQSMDYTVFGQQREKDTSKIKSDGVTKSVAFAWPLF